MKCKDFVLKCPLISFHLQKQVSWVTISRTVFFYCLWSDLQASLVHILERLEQAPPLLVVWCSEKKNAVCKIDVKATWHFRGKSFVLSFCFDIPGTLDETCFKKVSSFHTAVYFCTRRCTHRSCFLPLLLHLLLLFIFFCGEVGVG